MAVWPLCGVRADFSRTWVYLRCLRLSLYLSVVPRPSAFGPWFYSPIRQRTGCVSHDAAAMLLRPVRPRNLRLLDDADDDSDEDVD